LKILTEFVSSTKRCRVYNWYPSLPGEKYIDHVPVYNSSHLFACLDVATGELNYLSDQVEGGVNIFADGHFYSDGTDGVISLIEARKKTAG